eukprot:1587951-Prymnesium_polylepis.1
MDSVERALEQRRGMSIRTRGMLWRWARRWVTWLAVRRDMATRSEYLAHLVRCRDLRLAWQCLAEVVSPAAEARRQAESLVDTSVALLQMSAAAA